jgi:acyl CoA:acetate/3-ketoacid CoA transferase alpha subunit
MMGADMTKLSTLADAVASISDGTHVALSGFATARCVMAFAHEVIRQEIKELTVSQCVGAMDADRVWGRLTRPHWSALLSEAGY